MDHEPGWVDVVLTVHHFGALEINLHEARRSDLVEQHAIWIDQEMVISPRHARRDVSEDEIVPPIVCNQAITRREVRPLLPFRGTYLFSYV